MSVDAEARLVTLVEQSRAGEGDTILTDRPRLEARLLAAAPDLASQIRALAAALESGDVWRPRASIPAELLDRLVREVSAAEGIGPDLAAPGVRAAWRVARPGVAFEAPPPPQEERWIGESVVATPPPAAPAASAPTLPPAPTSSPAASPVDEIRTLAANKDWGGLLKNKWVLGALGIAAVLFFLNDDGGRQPQQPAPQQPAPQQQPPQQQPPQQQPRQGQGPAQPPAQPPQAGGAPQNAGGQGLPHLVDPQQGQLPRLAFSEGQGNPFVGFSLPSQNGDIYGIVMVSGQGWNGGAMVTFTRDLSGQPGSVSTTAPPELLQDQQGVARLIKPQWQFDKLGIKDICVGFHQQGARDVSLRGSTLCVYSANCARLIGCGAVP